MKLSKALVSEVREPPGSLGYSCNLRLWSMFKICTFRVTNVAYSRNSKPKAKLESNVCDKAYRVVRILNKKREKLDTTLRKYSIADSKKILRVNGITLPTVYKTLKKQTYKFNKLVTRTIICKRSSKCIGTTDHKYLIRRSTITKCSVNMTTIRLTIIDTSIINSNMTRTLRVVEKSVQTKAYKKVNRSDKQRQTSLKRYRQFPAVPLVLKSHFATR